MKRMKQVILASVLCLFLGIEALAAEPEQIAAEQQEADNPVSSQEGEESNPPQESDGIEWVKADLPIRNHNFPAIFFSGNEILRHNGEAIESQAAVALQVMCTPSERTFSQESAKEILNTDKDCKVIVLDLQLTHYPRANSDDIWVMVPKGKPLTDVLLTEESQLRLGPTTKNGMLWDDISENVKVVFLPADGSDYREASIISYNESTHEVKLNGLNGFSIPVKGASVVIISEDDSSSSAGTSNNNSNSSNSSRSERPEAYSRGETVGEIRVDKIGTQAHVRKADGTEDNVIVHPYLNPGTKTLTQSQARNMLGTAFACSIYPFDLSLVNAQEDYSAVTLLDGSVPVTFFVPGVTPESKVALRHWINGSNTYEDLPVELGNGTVKAEFTSFSPVVIVVEQPGVPAPADTVTSPKTGETPIIYIVEIIALLSLLGFVSCRKKYQS